MPIAVRKPQPSDPTRSLVSGTFLQLETEAVFNDWHWIEADVKLEAKIDCSLTALDFLMNIQSECSLSVNIASFSADFISANAYVYINVENRYIEQFDEEIDNKIALSASMSGGGATTVEGQLASVSYKDNSYKEFVYDGEGDLIGYSLYSSSDKSTKLFEVVFTIVDGQLTKKQITRIHDNEVVVVNYNYTGDVLTSISR